MNPTTFVYNPEGNGLLAVRKALAHGWIYEKSPKCQSGGRPNELHFNSVQTARDHHKKFAMKATSVLMDFIKSLFVRIDYISPLGRSWVSHVTHARVGSHD